MEMQFEEERRSPQSTPLRPGAMRCQGCGTTWFDQHAELAVGAGRSCRRCGDRLHTERRQPVVSSRAA